MRSLQTMLLFLGTAPVHAPHSRVGDPGSSCRDVSGRNAPPQSSRSLVLRPPRSCKLSRQHSAYLLFVPDRAELVRCGLQRCWVRQQPMALPTLRGEIRQGFLNVSHIR